nr:hypothetical protein [Mycobacterium tuberculosis]
MGCSPAAGSAVLAGEPGPAVPVGLVGRVGPEGCFRIERAPVGPAAPVGLVGCSPAAGSAVLAGEPGPAVPVGLVGRVGPEGC